ncbi:PEP-CTERM sorting domain-containing protein [Bowmanella yangjiangensis]|uniref:PEP-CTERM sorting domain-containing protein n=1 Tax=Bowmanella yangjiangensis TaxID=2811230 RepID=A0ABS3CPR7_9ALTE|nr:PEP-CTERM sorting domain-containing protein [Bowmanella yangjiangensis]MBN7818685.1 PEP-CTERM sorting domain-containing protein [Bowmanella yangjiangensis]
MTTVRKLMLVMVITLVSVSSARAAIISGTWNFEVGIYSGSFSFTNLDTSLSHINSTAAGFSVTKSFITSGTDMFTVDGDFLYLGADQIGEGVQVQFFTGSGIFGDWSLWSISLSSLQSGSATGYFQYAGTANNPVNFASDARITSAAAAVPEPASLALICLGLLGVAVNRKRKRLA